MSGPWERYAAPAAAPADVPAGPWTKYAAAPDKPLSVRAGEVIRDLPRQAGLTIRYGIEGAAALPTMVADIPGRVLNLGATGIEALGGPKLPRVPLAADAVPAALDLVGLPQPRTADERVVGDITRTMAGAGSAAKVADVVGRAVSAPAARAVTDALSSNVGTQVAAAAGSGAAGGSVREAGGGPWEQMIASLVGGVSAGATLPKVGDKAIAFKDWAKAQTVPKPTPQAVDLQISLALQRQGIDWASLSNDVRTSLRNEVSDALKTGGSLKPETLARLADFRTVGATPTRGTVTLDPVQITREKNLAKVGANSTDVNLQRLPQLENANNQALIGSLNRLGANAAGSQIAAGQALTGTLDEVLAGQQARVDSLYKAARDSSGRSFPLDQVAFTNRAATLLDDNLVSASLPADVRNVINRVARGEMPFTVDVAEQLKTRIGNLQRASNDGGTRMALGLVRQAIDETPILPPGQQSGPVGGARAVNPGNLPMVAGSTQLGDEAVAAFNQARSANRQMMQRIESVPALKAVYDGVEPDKFVGRFITGDGKEASLASLRGLRDAVGDSPEALQLVRQQILAYIKGRATNGAPDDVARFSAAGMRAGLDRIGPEKLRLFFSPEEIAQLQATSRVANYSMVQPVGSAVNNSNSGALGVAAGLDLLDRIAGKVPVVGDTIQGVVRGVQQTNALTVSPTLTNPRAAAQPLTISELARTSGVPVGTGLMLSTLPGVPRREDERR